MTESRAAEMTGGEICEGVSICVREGGMGATYEFLSPRLQRHHCRAGLAVDKPGLGQRWYMPQTQEVEVRQ